jgi:hypothetical protein
MKALVGGSTQRKIPTTDAVTATHSEASNRMNRSTRAKSERTVGVIFR